MVIGWIAGVIIAVCMVILYLVWKDVKEID
jgi:hypothetical protein